MEGWGAQGRRHAPHIDTQNLKKIVFLKKICFLNISGLFLFPPRRVSVFVSSLLPYCGCDFRFGIGKWWLWTTYSQCTMQESASQLWFWTTYSQRTMREAACQVVLSDGEIPAYHAGSCSSSGYLVLRHPSVELGSGTCSEPGWGFRVWSGKRGSGAREARSQATFTAPKP